MSFDYWFYFIILFVKMIYSILMKLIISCRYVSGSNFFRIIKYCNLARCSSKIHTVCKFKEFWFIWFNCCMFFHSHCYNVFFWNYGIILIDFNMMILIKIWCNISCKIMTCCIFWIKYTNCIWFLAFSSCTPNSLNKWIIFIFECRNYNIHITNVYS